MNTKIRPKLLNFIVRRQGETLIGKFLIMNRIPLSIPDLRGREIEFLTHCVRTNWVSSAGPQVAEFEEVVKSYTGRKYAVSTVNGTTALHIALVAAGIGAGDLVVVPDWTFAASVNAIYHAGATPYFHDISSDWSLDTSLVTQSLVEKNSRIKAVLAVHPIGRPAEIGILQKLCKNEKVILIEDAAGALGATYKGKSVGGFSDFATFSFNGNKVVTAGGGGMIVTDDDQFAKKVKHLSAQARCGTDYSHDAIGWNYRMTGLNAALGLAQMERIEAMISSRRDISDRYDQALLGRTDLLPPPPIAYGVSNGWLYNILCADENTARRLVNHMDKLNIETRIFWRTLSDQAPYKDAPQRLTGRSRSLSGRVVSLPSSSSLSSVEQDYIIQGLKDFRGDPAQPIT